MKHPHASIEVEELDVSKSESIKKFVDTIANKYKNVDVLVNNAGIAWKGDTFNPEVDETTFATVSLWSITEFLRDYLIKRGNHSSSE
jgi:NADP-dependent 3-hydroxy acid dehydrogenase YdfG